MRMRRTGEEGVMGVGKWAAPTPRVAPPEKDLRVLPVEYQASGKRRRDYILAARKLTTTTSRTGRGTCSSGFAGPTCHSSGCASELLMMGSVTSGSS